jgi:hypothetical protein
VERALLLRGETATRAVDGGCRARLRQVVFSVSVATCVGGWTSLAQPESPVGTWEYRQRNVGNPTRVDPEGERLVIAPAGERIAIAYFGLEREGEHGLYYTAVQATNVQRANGGRVDFTVPARTLYRTRPTSLAHAASLESAGVATYPLRLTAVRRGEVLIVTCASDDWSCPEPTMTFMRVQAQK